MKRSVTFICEMRPRGIMDERSGKKRSGKKRSGKKRSGKKRRLIQSIPLS